MCLFIPQICVATRREERATQPGSAQQFKSLLFMWRRIITEVISDHFSYRGGSRPRSYNIVRRDSNKGREKQALKEKSGFQQVETLNRTRLVVGGRVGLK